MSSNQNHSISRPQFFNSKGNGEQLSLSGTSGEDALHVSAGNANLVGNLSVSGETTVAGIRNSDVTSSAATSADVDLTSVSADHKLFLTGTFSAIVKLPQATANNIGMTIEVFFNANCEAGDTATAIAVADSGSTVMQGFISTSVIAGTSAKETTNRLITANSKRVVFKSDGPALGGGAGGTYYKIYYMAANKIFVTGFGLITGTVATNPGAGCSTTTGF